MIARSVVRAAVVLVALPLLAACMQTAEAKRTQTFCAEANVLLRNLAGDLGSPSSAPDQAGGLAAEVVERLDAVDPPAGVERQWSFLVDEWTAARDDLAKAGDVGSPGWTFAYAKFSVLQGQLAGRRTLVDDWGRANC
jgi:hypothetical protein